MATITENYDDVLDFLQAVAVKSLRVTAAPLSLCAGKRARTWFFQWDETNLPTPPKIVPQYHMGLTGVLAEFATRLQNAEALCPVFDTQCKEGMGLSTTNSLVSHPGGKRLHRTSIPTSLPPTLHRFIIARNATALQANCALAYAGNNLYLPTSFCQALIQDNILDIPERDAPTGLLPILTPPSSAGPANSHQWAIRIQVLLSMGQDCMSKEETGLLLEQSVHILMSTQDIRNLTRNVFNKEGD